MTDDEKLVHSIVRKRRGALERVIEIYTPYVSTVIYNACGAVLAQEDIEEIISDTFVTLWRSADKFDPNRGSLRAYLAVIARSLTINRMRQNKICEPENENIPAHDCDPYESARQDDERQTLIHALSTLGEPDSEIFLRYYWYDESITTIARRMGIKGGTIKSKLARGRQKLRNILEGRDNYEQTLG